MTINELINEINSNNFTLGGNLNINTLNKINGNLILSFAKEMCELQKIECLNNIIIDGHKMEYELDKTSILNCKNICDE